MGHSTYETTEEIDISIFHKNITFNIISDDFPIIEDGILGLPSLAKYDYTISKDCIKLDNNTCSLAQKDIEIEPGQSLKETVYLQGQPTPVCFFNGAYQDTPLLQYRLHSQQHHHSPHNVNNSHSKCSCAAECTAPTSQH
ncbi:uncharacterized protein LOC143262561 [Megalopta genalis]|uniref:uncharacterized protein LOC143262300 n=1 Tax=Megalopta genalis TaxID=115081 RepID=UPI003FCFD3EF